MHAVDRLKILAGPIFSVVRRVLGISFPVWLVWRWGSLWLEPCLLWKNIITTAEPPWALGQIQAITDTLLADLFLTLDDYPWPNFLITNPIDGEGPVNRWFPPGFIQLDILREVGSALIRASHLTGNDRSCDIRMTCWLRNANLIVVPCLGVARQYRKISSGT